MRLCAPYPHPETSTMPDPDNRPGRWRRVVWSLLALALIVFWMVTLSHVAEAIRCS